MLGKFRGFQKIEWVNFLGIWSLRSNYAWVKPKNKDYRLYFYVLDKALLIAHYPFGISVKSISDQNVSIEELTFLYLIF